MKDSTWLILGGVGVLGWLAYQWSKNNQTSLKGDSLPESATVAADPAITAVQTKSFPNPYKELLERSKLGSSTASAIASRSMASGGLATNPKSSTSTGGSAKMTANKTASWWTR